jgi:hypothetical protein
MRGQREKGGREEEVEGGERGRRRDWGRRDVGLSEI